MDEWTYVGSTEDGVFFTASEQAPPPWSNPGHNVLKDVKDAIDKYGNVYANGLMQVIESPFVPPGQAIIMQEEAKALVHSGDFTKNQLEWINQYIQKTYGNHIHAALEQEHMGLTTITTLFADGPNRGNFRVINMSNGITLASTYRQAFTKGNAKAPDISPSGNVDWQYADYRFTKLDALDVPFWIAYCEEETVHDPDLPQWVAEQFKKQVVPELDKMIATLGSVKIPMEKFSAHFKQLIAEKMLLTSSVAMTADQVKEFLKAMNAD